MFYYDQGYKITSEHTDFTHNNIAHIEVLCDDEPQVCPLCCSKVKRHSIKKRVIRDFNEEKGRVEIITLRTQKYVCKNPSHRHTFLSGKELDKASHTKRFDRYIFTSLVTDDRYNLSDYGKMFRLSHTVISDIVQMLSKEMRICFCPPSVSHILYLKPFTYMGKKRYFLGSIDYMGNQSLLAFFGYEDAEKEILDYFRFHLRYEEYPYGNHFLLIDINDEQTLKLLHAVEALFVYVETSIIPQSLHQFFEDAKEDKGDGSFNNMCIAIDHLRGSVCSSTDTVEDTIRKWENQEEDIKTSLESFWQVLKDHITELKTSHQYKPADFSVSEDYINKYKARNLPFDIMTACMMREAYGEYMSFKTDGPLQYGFDLIKSNTFLKESEIMDQDNLFDDVHTFYAKDHVLRQSINFDEDTGIQYFTLVSDYKYSCHPFFLEANPLSSNVHDLEPYEDEEIQRMLKELPFPADPSDKGPR